VFLDPSGRRWRTTRVVGIAALVGIVAALVYAAPKMWADPAQGGGVVGPPLSSKDTRLNAPVVGVGPLLRVLQVRVVDGKKVGFEPFTGARLVTLTGADAAKAGSARYVIQKFGYSATAHKTISMTFDDGPDPKVTPALLNVLSANKTPATFFVIGKSAAMYPQIVARMIREGHAVGNHTMTHPDIANGPTWLEHIELVATGRTLRAITGQEAGYWRMPYLGNDEQSQQQTIDGLLRAQRLGYTLANYDLDTRDWEIEAKPLGRMADIPLPNLSSGGNVTMLMHDAGGPNRMWTVEYVKKLIPYAKAHGYTFQTMPQIDPALAASIHPVTPTAADYATLYVVKMLFVWPNPLLSALFVFAMLAVVLLGFGNATLSWMRYRRRRRIVFPGPAEIALPTSVVLAAFNEEPVIARTLRSILTSDYPILEVIVVDDGSTDGTADEVRTVMAQDPRVVLLRQPNTGKAHALNNGVENAKGDFVVTLDADTIVTSSTVTKMLRHFALDGAGRLGAVAGVVRVGNRETNVLTRWQALEYLTQIGVERSAQDALGAISIIPGACAAWRKEAILDAGGYSNITLAEDCDLALTMHHLGWKVTQDDEALAYTEAPETVDDLLAQRTRWTFGTLQAIWKHRGMLFRRRYGALGCFVMPNYVLSVVTPVIFLPFIATMGYLALEQQGAGVLIEYFLLFLLAHLIIAAVAVRLMGEKYHHLLMVPVYRLVYEPLRAYLLYTSVFLAIKGGRMGWNKLVRTGSMDTSTITTGPQDHRSPDKAGEVLVPDNASALATFGTLT
jgi:cellulose synthase/poly-beta-1,6-N-acetylglucosamine synthase-like glycosyltransferase/peptidoglycan/xylan/chitin deacetylase (PgdA/CDA1 family)